MSYLIRRWFNISAFASAMLASTTLLAQTPQPAPNSQPSTTELIDALRGKTMRGAAPAAAVVTPPDAETTRLVAGLKQKMLRGLSITIDERNQLQPVVAQRRSVDMEIQFDFNSATIRPESKATLKTLAAALRSADLGDADFLIAGHTDAKGRVAINQRLSERRAQAVRAHLT
jgi:outer membrane protein OmpA-like peptidoglycan-associated protein